MGRRCPFSSRDSVLFEMPVASATPVNVSLTLRAHSPQPLPDAVDCRLDGRAECVHALIPLALPRNSKVGVGTFGTPTGACGSIAGVVGDYGSSRSTRSVNKEAS